MRFLNDVIVLNCLVNPDGMELVSDWYMREPEPAKRSTDNIPRLYNKYAGHDDNRDFYMTALSESEAINRVLYRDWFPQIVYNHHQTGPAGAVMFSPPFRDPFNFYYDPLVMTELDEVGAAMHSRFALEGKPGVTSRSGAVFSQPDRPADGDHRESDAHCNPVCSGEIASKKRSAFSDHTAAVVAFPPIDRLLDHRKPRSHRLRIAQQGSIVVQHLPHGNELDRTWKPG